MTGNGSRSTLGESSHWAPNRGYVHVCWNTATILILDKIMKDKKPAAKKQRPKPAFAVKQEGTRMSREAVVEKQICPGGMHAGYRQTHQQAQSRYTARPILGVLAQTRARRQIIWAPYL
jgi:hypothetical protein